MAIIKIAVAVVVVYFVLGLVVAIVKTVIVCMYYKKRMKRSFPEPLSEYREAFMMECSQDMIAKDPYAADLDKKIRKIDADNKAMKAAKKKMEDRWSSWKAPKT